MADYKVNNLHISVMLSGTTTNENDEQVGYNENKNIVLDFGNEGQIEKQLSENPWLMDIVAPIVSQLNKQYVARIADDAKPKEKTAALKNKLKGLI